MYFGKDSIATWLVFFVISVLMSDPALAFVQPPPGHFETESLVFSDKLDGEILEWNGPDNFVEIDPLSITSTIERLCKMQNDNRTKQSLVKGKSWKRLFIPSKDSLTISRIEFVFSTLDGEQVLENHFFSKNSKTATLDSEYFLVHGYLRTRFFELLAYDYERQGVFLEGEIRNVNLEQPSPTGFDFGEIATPFDKNPVEFWNHILKAKQDGKYQISIGESDHLIRVRIWRTDRRVELGRTWIFDTNMGASTVYYRNSIVPSLTKTQIAQYGEFESCVLPKFAMIQKTSRSLASPDAKPEIAESVTFLFKDLVIEEYHSESLSPSSLRWKNPNTPIVDKRSGRGVNIAAGELNMHLGGGKK